jgi:hypothetical protein
MLLFLGGAARTGKGLLSRRLLAELRVPSMSLDILKMGLARGAPEFPIDPDAGAVAVATRLWPIVREMCHNLIGEGVPYLIEGEVLPKQVAGLRDAYPSSVDACFLGYTAITPARKLRELRRHGGHSNDWPRELPDDAVLRIIEREIEFSRYLEAECRTHGFPYFDTSRDFLATQEHVVAHVREVLRAN